jgi:hypothetical protein
LRIFRRRRLARSALISEGFVGSCKTGILKAASKKPACNVATFFSIRVPRACASAIWLASILQGELLIALAQVFDVQRAHFLSLMRFLTRRLRIPYVSVNYFGHNL